MDLFFEIIQRALGLPAHEILLPERNSDNAMTFWQKVIRRNQQQRNDFYDVQFQFYMYMTWSCTRLFPKPRAFQINEDADEDEEADAKKKKGWSFVKFQQFFQTLDNLFFSSDFKEKMQSTFCKAQRTYHALSRFAQSWKARHARCTVDHDFTLSPIDRTKTNLFLTVHQNGVNYLFRVSELVHIVETALCHCTNFFVDSYVPKNPYTNEPFSKAILFHVYDRIRRSDYKMPVLFEHFFRCFFDINDFIFQHDAAIRDRHIARIIQYGDTEVLSRHIRKMLKFYRVFNSMDPHFPDAQLVRIFRPYLELYLCHFFSTVYGEKKEIADFLLKRQLSLLSAFNPILGQRVLLKKKDFDCPLNREKLEGKYYIASTNTDFVEVFSISHLPCHRLKHRPHTTFVFHNNDDHDYEDEDEDEDG
jgi:hypothetical protein